MACNPISERQVMVFTSDGRLSLIELDAVANNNGPFAPHETMPEKDGGISRPNFCIEDMLPGN